MTQDSPAQWCADGAGVCRADDDSSSIREMRLARRMQNRELAANMSVSQARISVLERDERRGAVTLKMMRKAAEALGCEFVYTLVPKNRSQPALKQAQQQLKPRIRLDSSQLGDTERQRLALQHEYARRRHLSTQA
jgi:transcriptional regulator with XRE-family HTH domain